MEKIELAICGYVSIDRIIRISTPVKIGVTSLVANSNNTKDFFGGNAANIAYCAAKLGIRTALMGRVGIDFKSLGFYDHLKNAGVNIDSLREIQGEATSVGYLIQDENGDHITMTYPGPISPKYATEDFNSEIFKKAKFGVITVGTYADTVQFMQKCRKFELPLIFSMRADFNCFPKPILGDVLKQSAIIFTNEAECTLIEKMFGINSITDYFYKGNAQVIVTTLGKDGSRVYWQENGVIASGQVPATHGGTVLDTTGAGDAYIAGFLYGVLQGYSPVLCAEFGSTEASFVIEQLGCVSNVPEKEEMLKRNKNVISERKNNYGKR